MADSVIKQRLLESLDITRQSLDGRVKTVQKGLPIAKDDAVYLIAFEAEVKIDDRLDPETGSADMRRQDEPTRNQTVLAEGRPSTTNQANGLRTERS